MHTVLFCFKVKHRDIRLDSTFYILQLVRYRTERTVTNNFSSKCTFNMQDLHELHEDWLLGDRFPRPAPVIVLDANKVPTRNIILLEF